ncbi:unnamed protein product [Ectocarpus sp. 12 AP-2014]
MHVCGLSACSDHDLAADGVAASGEHQDNTQDGATWYREHVIVCMSETPLFFVIFSKSQSLYPHTTRVHIVLETIYHWYPCTENFHDGWIRSMVTLEQVFF